VPIKVEKLFALLDVPELGRVVHGACSNQKTVWIEAETYDFHFMSFESVSHLSIVRIPNFRCPIEGPGHNEVSEGIIECHSVDYIFMLLQRKQFSATLGVPYFTRSIVGASNELVSRFIKGTVRQRKQMCSQYLKQLELLLLILHLLFN